MNMQSRTLKLRKNYPKHVELMTSPPDPNTSIAHMLEAVGERKKVLDVGCASGYFASLLGKQECDVVGVDINPIAAEEARKYCTSVLVADLDEVVLPDLLDGKQFDAIVFGDVLEHLHEPARTLDESRALLGERGYVVASIPNVSHGAIRLALLSGRFDYQELGILDDSHLRFFTAKTIDELFLTAGFRSEIIQRVTLPLFAESDLVPALDARDFDERAIAEVRSDPESETLQFIVKAFPLSNDQRLRTVSKRFLAANTELAATKQQIAHRESELQALRAAVESQDALVLELRSEAGRTTTELEAALTQFKRLEDAYRALEVDSFAKQNAAMERIVAAQTQHAQSIEAMAELKGGIEQPGAAVVDLRAVESLDELERETSVLRAQLESERERAAAMAATRDEAQQLLENERRRAAIRELRMADAVAGQNEARLQLELLQSSVLELKAELGDKAQLEDALQAERDRATELQRLADSQQMNVDALRDEMLALERGTVHLESTLQTERTRAEGLQARAHDLQAAFEFLDSKLALAGDELAKSQVLRQEMEREYSAKIARTESDCDELLEEATAIVDAARARFETERSATEAERNARAQKVSELEEQLEAIRKAALADKLVMRAYANEFQQRAEEAEAEFTAAIRQRDDLYLRVLETERVVRDSAEHAARLQAEVAGLEEAIREGRVGGERARALETEVHRLKGIVHEERSRSGRAEVAVHELSARAKSLENDVTNQQASLQALRESAERERSRAESVAVELSSLTVRYEILQGNLAEMDNRLAAQTEELLVCTSAENARLATLIDTVQSSHFWKLKNWLVRLRVRALGAARPSTRVEVRNRQ